MTVQVYKGAALADFLLICEDLLPSERVQIEALTGEPYNASEVAARQFLAPGTSWTLVADGKPTVVAGFNEVRRGVWQTFMLSTPEAFGDKLGRIVTREVRKVMDAAARSPGVHRLQCLCLASRIEAHQWYRILRLHAEAPLAKYGANGEDFIMFARTGEG